jgi:DNA-binding response OmpR family regulator
MSKILFVGKPEEGSSLAQSLQNSDLQLQIAPTSRDAVRTLDSSESEIDLILLSWALPDGSGLHILNHVQSHEVSRYIPVFLLSNQADLASKISAFSLGADDYLVEPVDLLELRARMEMRLRKSQQTRRKPEVLRKGNLELNIPLMKASKKTGSQIETIELTGKEFRILAFLAQNEGQVYSRSELVRAIWGEATHVLDRTVDSHICGLRRKLDHCADYIECIPSVGYRFATQEGVLRS